MGIRVNHSTGEINFESTLIVGKQNHNASVNPSVTDDVDAGYNVGSVWTNTTSREHFRCFDNTAGAAVWDNTTDGGTY